MKSVAALSAKTHDTLDKDQGRLKPLGSMDLPLFLRARIMPLALRMYIISRRRLHGQVLFAWKQVVVLSSSCVTTIDRDFVSPDCSPGKPSHGNILPPGYIVGMTV